jgi:hypothetical protein
MRNPFSSNAFGQTPDASAYSFGQPPGDHPPPPATEGAPDERVRQALEMLGFDYTVSPLHNFRIVVSWADEGRTQAVAIGSHTSTFRGREWRQVWSDAFSVSGKLSWAQALWLLNDGDRHAFGGWCIAEDGGQTRVYYTAPVPADASSSELHDAIGMAAEQADELEKATLGTDTN